MGLPAPTTEGVDFHPLNISFYDGIAFCWRHLYDKVRIRPRDGSTERPELQVVPYTGPYPIPEDWTKHVSVTVARAEQWAFAEKVEAEEGDNKEPDPEKLDVWAW